MKNNFDMVHAWYKFDFGDKLSDEELIACVIETKAAIKYLSNRHDGFADSKHKCIQTLNLLEMYTTARGLIY